jgi:purine nucleosidase
MFRSLAAAVLFVSALLAARPAAPWPPSGPVRVVIDADAANEIDDQYALSLALGSPDRFRLEGLVAAHFGETGGAAGIDRSYAEILRVLELAGMAGKFPVKRGADPLQYRDRIPASEGVDFIIERAKAASPDDPLWLVLLGPATDAAAALLKAPSIADRLVVFWHGRTQWPVRAWNFNAYNDILAARLIFELSCRLVLFDTGTYLRIPKEETERRFAPLGPLGAYLHQIRLSKPAFASPTKGFFDLGDIAAIADPACARWEKVTAPAVDRDLRYDFSRDYGEIVRIYHVESEPTFNLLEAALRRLRPAR